MPSETRRRALLRAAFVLAALAAGVAVTGPVVRLAMNRIAIHDGPWLTSPDTGRAGANLYVRAAVAVAGLYALARSETLYYTALTDSAGDALDGRCDYTVRGAPPPARWWSLTLYGADNYLVPNRANVYSRHAGNLAFAPDGRFIIAVSAQTQAQNWLPAPPQGNFSLTLRLYQPADAVQQDLAGLALPAIERGACR